MNKEYVIELNLRSGSDEFWESDPSKADVVTQVRAALDDVGFYDVLIKVKSVIETCDQ